MLQRAPFSAGVAATVTLVLASACGAPRPDAPVKMMAFVQAADGVYKAQPIELKTVTDVVAMDGDVAKLIGNARIVIDPNDPLWNVNGGNLTDAQLADILIKSPGGTPRASYVEKDGVLWPFDFHTWGMVSTYYNFENAFAYFDQTASVPMDALRGVNASKVYYFAEFVEVSTSPEPENDNALFYPPIKAFAVLPFKDLQQVPFGMNFGVIAHEFSHRVFHIQVEQGQALPSVYTRWSGTTEPQLNLLKSLDEGLADYHAVQATCLLPYGCDPRFFSHSLPVNDPVGIRRDISRSDQCLTEGLRNSLDNESLADFSGAGKQYDVGDVFAAALYQAGQRDGKHAVVQRAMLAAYNDLSPASPGISQLIFNNLETPENFTLAKVADIVLQHVTDPGLKTTLCNEFLDRLFLNNPMMSPQELMPHCPATASGGTHCRITP